MERTNQMYYLHTKPNEYLIRYRHLLDDTKYKYQAIGSYWYYSERYNNWLFIEDGFKADGATDAPDIHSNAWWFHDKICNDGGWFDGTLASNWSASTVLGDILWDEANYYKTKDWKLFVKRRGESIFWWFATFLFGGGKARENGMFRVKNTLARVDDANTHNG